MDTDVSTAQSFDASSFFGGLLTTAGNVYVASQVKTTQGTGVPAVTTSPSLVARPGAGVAVPGQAISTNQILIGLGVVAAIVVVFALRK